VDKSTSPAGIASTLDSFDADRLAVEADRVVVDAFSAEMFGEMVLCHKENAAVLVLSRAMFAEIVLCHTEIVPVEVPKVSSRAMARAVSADRSTRSASVVVLTSAARVVEMETNAGRDDPMTRQLEL